MDQFMIGRWGCSFELSCLMNSLVMIFIAFSEMIVEMRGGALVDELGDDLHQPFSRLKYTILFHQFHGEITILHFLFDG